MQVRVLPGAFDLFFLVVKILLYNNDNIMIGRLIRKIKPIDLTKLIEPHEGKWVTLTPNGKKVLGASKNLNEALRQAKVKGFPRPFLVKSPGYEMVGFFH